MTPNTDLHTQAEELDFGKLLADDTEERHRSYDILVPVAKAAAKAAINDRSETELKSVAFEAILEMRKGLNGFVEKGGSTEDLKDLVATIAKRRSIDLWRKDTGARRKKPIDTEDEASVPAGLKNTNLNEDTPSHIGEHKEQLREAELAHREAERLGHWKGAIRWGLDEIERREGKMGKIYRIIVEGSLAGFSIEQLAEKLSKSTGYVGSTKMRAIARFKEIIKFESQEKQLESLASKH